MRTGTDKQAVVHIHVYANANLMAVMRVVHALLPEYVDAQLSCERCIVSTLDDIFRCVCLAKVSFPTRSLLHLGTIILHNEAVYQNLMRLQLTQQAERVAASALTTLQSVGMSMSAAVSACRL